MKQKTCLIAEIAQAHDGSLGIAHSYIDALATTGVDAVKFQTHIAAAESSAHEPFRVKFSYEDATRYDYWQRMEFTKAQWKELKAHCSDVGLEFISSPFSNAAIDLLEEIGVDRYKVGSGEISNFLLLEKMAQTGKPVILSSGMSNWGELDKSIQYLQERNIEVSVLQCTTAYPTKPEQWGLNVIPLLKERYNIPVGFSDHSGAIYACIAAATLGAEILEFHTVFDKRMFGPDAKASLTIDEIKELAAAVKMIATSLATPVDKANDSGFAELKNMFGKSLAINKDLPAGHKITFDDLEAKKPQGHGINAAQFEVVIGRSLIQAKKAHEFLNEHELEA